MLFFFLMVVAFVGLGVGRCLSRISTIFFCLVTVLLLGEEEGGGGGCVATPLVGGGKLRL